jgi:hypothetical protein
VRTVTQSWKLPSSFFGRQGRPARRTVSGESSRKEAGVACPVSKAAA